ncbi:MAG: TolB family protein [Cyanobium sp.]
MLVSPVMAGCSLGPANRRSAGSAGLGPRNREDPALSGDGRLLASLIERGGQPAVVLQEQASGRVLPLRHLNRHTPHRSPALSWNGRYLAVLSGAGRQRRVLLEDRATGRLHRLMLPPDQEPERLSLAPDGRRLALEVGGEGRPRLRLFDLAGLLEPDRPAGADLGRP